MIVGKHSDNLSGEMKVPPRCLPFRETVAGGEPSLGSAAAAI
jgi:hypothetical protein